MEVGAVGIRNRVDVLSLLVAFVAVTVVARASLALLTGATYPSPPIPSPAGVGPAAWGVVLGVAHLLAAVAINSTPYHLLLEEDQPRTLAQGVVFGVLFFVGLFVYV